MREIDVRIAVDGTPLRYRSPVPFAGSTGYRGAPGGPFNDASDPLWEVGEQASLEVAGTNAPSITAGSSLPCRALPGRPPIATAETVAR